MNVLPEKLTVKYYHDPGHGWIAVKRKIVDTLGIADKITGFSYQKGQTVYLEEDRDASLFMEAAKARGIEIVIDERYRDPCPIRNYNRYPAVSGKTVEDIMKGIQG